MIDSYAQCTLFFMQKLSFIHPVSHEPLTREDGAYTSSSGDSFEDTNGLPCFVDYDVRQHMEAERSGVINALKNMLRRSPLLYRFLIILISPVCFSGVSPKKFITPYPKDALLLNIGSGVHRYRDDQINLDIFPYSEVDIVADATKMPLADNTVDAVLCEFLLEHVPDAQKVIDEIFRVLKPEGKAYIAVPFVYPFHASPNDFHRWSTEGLRYALREGDVQEIGTRAGPTSALTAQLVTWTAIAVSFGSETLYSIASVVLLLLFFPLKFLDLIFGRFPTSVHGAADVFAIVKKRRKMPINETPKTSACRSSKTAPSLVR